MGSVQSITWRPSGSDSEHQTHAEGLTARPIPRWHPKRWFAKTERDLIHRGIFTSTTDLSRKLLRYIREHNRVAKPIVGAKA